jgi:hypothetical protein
MRAKPWRPDRRASSVKKTIGKPCAGNPQAGFERGFCPFTDEQPFLKVKAQNLPMDDAASRAARRRAEWTGGVVRSFAEMDEVDLAFWRSTTAEQRIRAMWSIVEDALALKGHSGCPPRLQRSIGGVRPLRG